MERDTNRERGREGERDIESKGTTIWRRGLKNDKMEERYKERERVSVCM